MLDFFDWFVDTAKMFLDFLWNIIDSLITLLSAVTGAVALPPVLLGLIPGVVGSCMITVVAIAVAKLIAGRE